MNEGPWIKVQHEVHQDPFLRHRIIKRVETALKARVVTFFVSFRNPDAMIMDDDAEMLESLLSVEHETGRLLLILSSPGGYALAAERIVNVCRAYSKGRFEVAVPHMAKSAATMICFGAQKIHMSVTAELGPVDPQVTYHDDNKTARWISAEEYVRAYEQLMLNATNGQAKRIEPYLQQLQRFDARQIESLKSAQTLSKDISLRLLKTGMMQGKSDREILKGIQVFLSQEATSSHGRMISGSEAKSCGLNVNIIDLHSPLWNDLWELYVRGDWYVTHKCRKMMESASSSVRQ
jgi:ClpP class serine protease